TCEKLRPRPARTERPVMSMQGKSTFVVAGIALAAVVAGGLYLAGVFDSAPPQAPVGRPSIAPAPAAPRAAPQPRGRAAPSGTRRALDADRDLDLPAVARPIDRPRPRRARDRHHAARDRAVRRRPARRGGRRAPPQREPDPRAGARRRRADAAQDGGRRHLLDR